MLVVLTEGRLVAKFARNGQTEGVSKVKSALEKGLNVIICSLIFSVFSFKKYQISFYNLGENIHSQASNICG